MNVPLGIGNWPGLFLRIIVAALAGGIIGYNREVRGKPAGLRTHVLVSLGAAVFVMIPMALSNSADIEAATRVIQGVAAGIGFLGAGEILRASPDHGQEGQVKGLTSA